MEALVFQEPTSDRDQNSEPAEAPPSADRAIFRPEARQRYIQNQEKMALPRLASPRVFVYLWIAALIFTVVGFIVAFWPLIGQLG
jgi:hypothetical protein